MIVFFDGVCGLCNGAVDFLIARDKNLNLQFTPLQGATAQARLPLSDTQNLNSIVVVDGAVTYRKSAAVLHAIASLSPGWRLLAFVLNLLPRFFRDAVYDAVAGARYSIFGQRDTCRLPTPAERPRFLD